MTIRKIAAWIGTLSLLLSCAGCALPERLLGIPDPEKYQTAFESNPQYSTLSDEEKRCYGSLYTALTDNVHKDETVLIRDTDGTDLPFLGTEVRLPHPMQTKEEIDRLYNAFFRDNPQFFYVRHIYGMKGYSLQDETYYDTLILTYTDNAAWRTQAAQALETAVNTILSQRPDTEDEYLTELYLHDRLSALCTYDQQAAQTAYENAPLAYTAYGALVTKTAVCEGYARALQLLLNRCGISSVLITGQAKENNEHHMWNLVTVNGQGYYVDPTWNDNEDQLRHTYFNITDEQLKKTHTPDKDQYIPTVCTATADNYFLREDAYIDTYERNRIAAVIAAQINKGATTVELCFSEETFDNGLLFLKNTRMTEKLVNPYLSGEIKELWPYHLTGLSDLHLLAITKKEE